MKTVSLNVFDRLKLCEALTDGFGDILEIRKAIRVVDRIGIREDEQKLLGFRQADNRLEWNTDKGRALVDFNLEDADYAYLVEIVTTKNNWNKKELGVVATVDRVMAAKPTGN